MNVNEYHAVILAGLLHDFGKFLIRPIQPSARHESAGVDYWERRIPLISEYTGIPGDLMLTLLGGRSDHPLWALVKTADGLAAGEREPMAGGAHDPNLLRASYYTLDSIFASVNLSTPATVIPPRYVHAKLDLDHLRDIFPDQARLPTADQAADIESAIQSLKDGFDRDLDHLLGNLPHPTTDADRAANFDRLYNTLLTLLQSYWWCAPSDLQQERESDIRDISLYDHSRVVSSIAACLYLYHDASQTLANAEAIRARDEPKFLMIGGDLSGIQNYLYEIATIGAGGAAKRLRARSFILSALVEAIGHRALRSLLPNAILPVACRIFSAGGRYTLLAPNLPQQLGLTRLESQVNSWLTNEFHGELSVSFAAVTLSGNDFAVASPARPMQTDITHKLAELDDALASRKARKLQSVLAPSGSWGAFHRDWGGTGEQTLCPSCRKFLAPKTGEELCPHCRNDRDLGRELANAQWVAFFSGHLVPGNNVIRFFEPTDGYSVAVYRDLPAAFAPPPFLIEKISGPSVDITTIPAPATIRYVSNYVPRDENGEIRDFEWIAAQSDGEPLLGVLKADVDRLGMIFSMGLEHASLSRIATLSRMIDLFFGGWLNDCIARDYQHCYIVYAGGDDLLVVGPWEEVTRLAIRVNREFRRFTANNPWITLSAGVAVVKDRFPIAKSSKLAGEYLEQAKEGTHPNDERGNRLHLFGTTVEWDQLPELLGDKKGQGDYAHFLAARVKTRDDDLGKQRGFLHRLLQYSSTCKRWLDAPPEQKRPRDLLYRPHLIYDIVRNIAQVEHGKIVNEEVVRRLDYLGDPSHAALMAQMRLPITWAILNTRRRVT